MFNCLKQIIKCIFYLQIFPCLLKNTYHKIYIMILRFLIYGICGWVIEVLFTGVCSAVKGDVKLASRTYLWMFPIYGMGILLEPIHNVMRGNPWIFRGLVYALIIFVLEYIFGFLLKQITGVCPWDYSGVFALNGYIRFDFLPLWFATGLLFEIIHDFITNTAFI